MKRILATLAASAAMIGFAYAGEIEGTVASVDAESGTIMLEDGQTFAVQDGVELDGLMPGAQVRVVYDDQTMEVTDVQTL